MEDNLAIVVSGVGARSGLSVSISNKVADLETLEKAQWFPLYLYESPPDGSYRRCDALTDAALAHCRSFYGAAAAAKAKQEAGSAKGATGGISQARGGERQRRDRDKLSKRRGAPKARQEG